MGSDVWMGVYLGGWGLQELMGTEWVDDGYPGYMG